MALGFLVTSARGLSIVAPGFLITCARGLSVAIPGFSVVRARGLSVATPGFSVTRARGGTQAHHHNRLRVARATGKPSARNINQNLTECKAARQQQHATTKRAQW